MNIEENNMEPNELSDELSTIRYVNTYTVPINYFDGLAEDIIGKIHLPLLTNAPYSAPPSGYFNSLADSVLEKIKTNSSQNEVQKELEEIEPLLTQISKTSVYRVPEGYFASFKVPAGSANEAVVIPMKQPSNTWVSYAAAAVIAGVIAISVIFAVQENGTGTDSNSYTQALANVPDSELADYLDQTSSEADITPIYQDDNTIINGEGIFKVLLNNVSDNEIENYLNENNDSDEKNIKGI